MSEILTSCGKIYPAYNVQRVVSGPDKVRYFEYRQSRYFAALFHRHQS